MVKQVEYPTRTKLNIKENTERASNNTEKGSTAEREWTIDESNETDRFSAEKLTVVIE